MQPYFIIFTTAYNAEKTLRRAVESVLNQTYTKFNYYILDNGSTDSTKKIIDEYASCNECIFPMYRETNRIGVTIEFAEEVQSKQINNNCFFTTLDADDEYTPDFLEKMLVFVTENNFDVAACGTDWIDEKTGEIIKHMAVDKNLILEGKDFAEYFPIYRNFMTTVWGGVYSLDLLKRCDFKWAKNAIAFSDTAFVMETFRRARRAGVLAESLHKYYLFPKSVSSSLNPSWFKACRYLDTISREYLCDYGVISHQNEDYLYVQLLILIKYILPKIQNANADVSEKVELLNEIFRDKMTQYMLSHWSEVGIYSDKREFLQDIKSWTINQGIGERDIDFIKL